MKNRKGLLLIALFASVLMLFTGCTSQDKASDAVVDLVADIIKRDETGVVKTIVTDVATDIAVEIMAGSNPEEAMRTATDNVVEQVSSNTSMQARLLFWVVLPLLVAIAYRIYNVHSARKRKLEQEHLRLEEKRLTGKEYLDHVLKYDYSFKCNYQKAGDRDIQVRNEIDEQFEAGELNKKDYRTAIEKMAR